MAAIFEGIKAYLSADGQRLLLFRLEDHLHRLYAWLGSAGCTCRSTATSSGRPFSRCCGPTAAIATLMCGHGVLITPSFTSDVLDSVTRATVLELARSEAVRIEVREVDRSELYLADELFCMGTGWEILPITQIDGLPVGDGKIGPVTVCLMDAYTDVVRGKSDRYCEWLTEIAIDEREA